jgi:branched-subunit amino acid aminotransferase/4-amino-4-deoxychorismate lyase
MARLLSSQACHEALTQSSPPQGEFLLSFYSSVLNGITTDPVYMTLPIDDHMVHRGHAVFDTCNLIEGKVYGLSFHLDRFLRSARDARIPHFASKDELANIILHTVAATNRRSGVGIRYWMSAGRGDFSIHTSNLKHSNFYVACHVVNESLRERSAEVGVSEVIVRHIPLKSRELATLKSNNYLINALTAMAAKDLGGTLGIQLDPAGNLAECSIGSVSIVTASGVLKTPKLDLILRGTTLLRAHALFLSKEATTTLPITDFVFCDITPAEALSDQVVEMIEFGGAHVTPIVQLDGKKIGTGQPGPVFKAFHTLLKKDMLNAVEFLDNVPYASSKL